MERRVGYKYCVVCGAEYKICPNCEKLAGRNILSWKYTCDTPECFQIYLVLKGYVDGEYNKESAKELLISLEVETLKSVDENSKILIDEIMHEEIKSESDILKLQAPIPKKTKDKNVKH